jgi:uncharacterized protein (TIGR01244 family)
LVGEFRELSSSVFASPQITLADIEIASSAGVRTIVNNRPEGESEDQTPGSAIEAAARTAGIDYIAIPISHGNFGQSQVQAMIEVLENADGKILAYCRTGTRSTLLWALAQAARGVPLGTIASAATAAGYDISPVWPAMIELAQRGVTDVDSA